LANFRPGLSETGLLIKKCVP